MTTDWRNQRISGFIY